MAMKKRSQDNIKVSLIACTANIEETVAAAAHLCYSPVGVDEIKEKMTIEKRDALIRRMVSSGHLSTVEHVSFTFAIEGISRACTHQLVRHRIASYSQQSQRYVKASGFKETLIKPQSIAENPSANKAFDRLMDMISEYYDAFLEMGIPAEDARFVLPNAAETKIVVTMNARSLMHFFEERCCIRAQWEIRRVAELMLRECRKVAPVLFEKAGATCIAKGFCKEGKHGCGRLAGGNKSGETK